MYSVGALAHVRGISVAAILLCFIGWVGACYTWLA